MLRIFGIIFLYASLCIQFVSGDIIPVPDATAVLSWACLIIGIVLLLLYRLMEFSGKKHEKPYDKFKESVVLRYFIIIILIFIPDKIVYLLPTGDTWFFNFLIILKIYIIILLLIKNRKINFENRGKISFIKKYQKMILTIPFTAPTVPMLLYFGQLLIFNTADKFVIPGINNTINEFILNFYIKYDYYYPSRITDAYRKLFYDFAHIYAIFTAAGLAYLAYIYLSNHLRKNKSIPYAESPLDS